MTLLYRPEREGGVFGDGGVSTPGIAGLVHNLSLGAGPLGSFVVSFLWQSETGDTDGDGYLFLLVIDGDVTGVVRPGVAYTTEPYADGDHDIRVVPVPSSQGVPLGLSVDLLGDRAIVTWEPGLEADLVGYQLFWDAGTGTVNTATPKATITTINVPEDYGDILPSISVGGTGRIRVSGKYTGPVRNGFVTVQIDNATAGAGEFLAAGQRQWTVLYQGDPIATGRLYAGLQISPLEGLKISFLDAQTTYQAGNTYFFFLGPGTFWVSEALDPATYKFQVKALDAEGDTGTLSSEVSVAVASTPAPLTSVTAQWNPATRVVTLDWVDPAEGGTAYLYTNYDFAYDVFRDYILEEGPAFTALTSAESVDTTALDASAVGGVLRMYARVVLSGVEEDNASLITLNLTAADVATGLSTVVIESTAVVAGPRISATLAIDAEGVLPTALRLLTNTTDTPTGATAHVVSIPAFTLATGNVLRGAVNTGTLADDDYYIWIQAQNAGGDWTDAGQSIGPITILNTTPAQVTGVAGATY